MLTPSERLRRALQRQPVDRPPVICPGGMMSLATADVMRCSGFAWPEAHQDFNQMAGLALAMHDLGGLENLATPFCMTIEAEALGAEIEFGDETTQPRVALEPHQTAQQALAADWPVIADHPRAQVMLEALAKLVSERPETPTLGNLVGPVSLAASLVQPDRFLKQMVREPQPVQILLERVTERLIEFGRQQVQAGADIIAIADPTATGEILGPRLFATVALPALQRLVAGLHAAGALVIVHICGSVKPVAGLLAGIGAEAISVDDMVHLGRLRGNLPEAAVMGNLSALLLERGPVTAIERWVRVIGLKQADIIAPACALVPTTPLMHLQALVAAVHQVNDGEERIVT